MIRQLRLIALVTGLLLFSGSAFAQAGRWLETQQNGNVVYFLSGAPAEIARYDLSTGTFLAPIILSLPPTSMAVDDDGIYVAYTADLVRFDLDGSNETALTTVSETARELLVAGDNLYAWVGYWDEMWRLDKNTGVVAEQPDFFYSMRGLSIAPTAGKIFGRTSSVSPSDMLQVALGASGELGSQSDSPYHGDYPGASKTWVFPDESKVVDNAAIVYNTADLTYAGALNGSGFIDHVAFNGNESIVLRSGILTRFTDSLLYVGEVRPANPLHSIFVADGDVIGFYNDAMGNLAVETIPLASLAPPDPGPAIDPAGLVYTPDKAVAAADGSVLLLSEASKSIFRWSPQAHAYTQSIPLASAPDHFAYSAMNDAVYLGYADGRITKVLLDTGVEEPFASVPSQVMAMQVADPYVFAVDPAGAWVSHFTFDAAGQQISQVEWNYFSRDFQWNAANRKMYHFRDDTSPNDLLWEDIDINGVIGAQQDSPYHSSAGIQHPIRVAENGSYVLLGSGRIFNALTLDELNTTPNPVLDAQWRSDGSIAAVTNHTGQLQLQELSRTYAEQKAYTLPSSFAMLVASGDSPIVIWEENGVPQFFAWNFGTDDIDGDGSDDGTDLWPLNPLEWADADADGVGDNADTDDDNDGYLDVDDDFPTDPTEWLDTDMDGVGNNADNDDDGDGYDDGADLFPLDGTEWADADNDGVGDNGDPDDDNDGYLDVDDSFPLDPAEWLDTDSDGVGNNADNDDDGDGFDDVSDLFPLDNTEWEDADGDGAGDNADTDDDNDGMPDTWETTYGLDPLDNSDANGDLDGDGATNLAEYNAGTNPTQAPLPPAPAGGGGGGSMGIGLGLLLVACAGRRRRLAANRH